MKIYAGTYEDAEGSDVVIITSGLPRTAGQSRIDLAQTNVDVIKQIAPDIVKHAPDALYILGEQSGGRTDLYVLQGVRACRNARIIGSGTILDTARLRSRIAEYLEISQKNIHAYVMGEHGDSSFVPWSIAQVGSVNFLDYKRRFHYKKLWNPEIDPDEIENYIRTSGAKIIGRKGATFYAIAISVCTIVQCMFGSANTAMTVSSMLHGEYGINDVCLSIPVPGRAGRRMRERASAAYGGRSCQASPQRGRIEKCNQAD